MRGGDAQRPHREEGRARLLGVSAALALLLALVPAATVIASDPTSPDPTLIPGATMTLGPSASAAGATSGTSTTFWLPRLVWGAGSLPYLGDFSLSAVSRPSGNGSGYWTTNPISLGESRPVRINLSCVISDPGTDTVQLFGRLSRTVWYQGQEIVFAYVSLQDGVAGTMALLFASTSAQCQPEGVYGYFSGYFWGSAGHDVDLHIWPPFIH